MAELTGLNKSLSKEIEAVNRRLKAIADDISAKELKKEILKPAAEPVVEAARSLAPVSSREHYRYNTPKLSGKLRAPKGKGVRIAKYLPGHLRDSIRVLSLRRAVRVFVGPKRSRRAGRAGGTFGPGTRRFDAYYAQMVFGGAKAFQRKVTGAALRASQVRVLRIIERGLAEAVRRSARENNINAA